MDKSSRAAEANAKAGIPPASSRLMLLISIASLYVELVLIRWLGTEIRVFAFVGNLVLVACFLGFGVGCLRSEKPGSLMPTLAALLMLAMVVGLPSAGWQNFLLDLSNLLTLSPDAVLWGDTSANHHDDLSLLVVPALGLIAGILWLITMAMVPLGRWIGYYFDQSKDVVRTYSVNLVGSLIGSWLLVGLSLMHLSPPWWVALAFALVLLTEPKSKSNLINGGAVLLVTLSVMFWQHSNNVYWSPYQKLQVYPMKSREAGYYVYVNNVGYMTMINLTPEYQKKDASVAKHDASFDSSFRFLPKNARVLVMGAGAGNDVAAALRNGASHVDAVEIDPVIYGLGKKLHPEHPYDSDKVTVVINDARHFLRDSTGQYDAIVFGFLDSVTQSSGYTNMRVDNYVYSKEAFARARELLKPDGILILKFDARAPWTWIGHRFYRTLAEVFGKPPIAYEGPNFGHLWPGAIFLNSKDPDVLQKRAAATGQKDFIAAHPPPFPLTVDDAPAPSTDDWPYPFNREHFIPRTYLTVSAILVLMAFFMVKSVLEPKKRMTWTMFALGSGFMLMETQLISRLTLYFGTTWIVNSIAVSTVLAVLVLANVYLETGKRPDRRRECYAVLILSLIANYFVPWEALPLSSWTVGLLLSAAYAVSVLMAGIIFTTTFREAPKKSSALGANVIGAVVGGLSLNLSFMIGLKALLLLAVVCYGAAAYADNMHVARRRSRF